MPWHRRFLVDVISAADCLTCMYNDCLKENAGWTHFGVRRVKIQCGVWYLLLGQICSIRAVRKRGDMAQW